MTSAQIRQSFLDFFKSKQHTIVPSSSLMPDSPNLLFTNAGMNQFVPIFLGQTKCPYTPGRAADTQKCIRAGGKHNDLDDVGLDTYHHTFFEMLGNWSFGNYFKEEAIDWAWDLIVDVWKFPPQRLYATVYCPYMGAQGWEEKWKAEINLAIDVVQKGQEAAGVNHLSDKTDAGIDVVDQEAARYWACRFLMDGIDPRIHVVPGNKKDNFWMMGETGPCGPCSELHVDLTPDGDTRGSLVNKSDARCIEIWNLVFIQFNANPDGTFSPLPAKHVDTGMGFERVTSIIQGTKNFSDFASAKISNYETDIFRPIFDELEKLSGKKYGSTLPGDAITKIKDDEPLKTSGEARGNIIEVEAEERGAHSPCDDEDDFPVVTASAEQIALDIAFRVIADHIRTLSFAIADGIQPGNTDRNYVLRRILRRAVRYGRTLGFHEPFFYKLVDVLADTMGDVFLEIRARKKQVQETIQREEEAFNKTLDRGIELFNDETAKLSGSAPAPGAADRALAVGPGVGEERGAKHSKRRLPHFERPWGKYMVTFSTRDHRQLVSAERDIVMESILYAHNHRQYQLFAACVMPDHAHILFEPQIKEQDKDGKPVFYSLGEIMHGIKSTTAHKINKAAKVTGVHVWEEESFDRLMRGDSDLEEKFHYICRNPWVNGVVPPTENYRWLWTTDASVTIHPSEVSREGARNNARGGRAPQIMGDFAFKLYDTYGFPLDLTELMARERGLTVDKEGFEKLMDEQRARARAAQKKEVISLSQIETTAPTKFTGFEKLESPARVLEVVSVKDKTAVVLDTSPFYAEMGGQVGDTGEISGGGNLWRVSNTQKSGDTWLHFIEAEPITDADHSRGAHAPSRVSDRALAGGTDARPRASSGGTTEPKYSRRNLPHFERPWAKYMITFSTRERRNLTPPERDLVLKSVLYAHEHRQYQLYAACVMPEHVHLLFEPQIKTEDKDGKTVFWSLSDILQGIKSASAHNINKALGQTGHVWEQESMDQMIRGQSDLEEKFHYICRNPWDAGVVELSENYPWLWTPDASEPRALARVGAADEASAATREARVLPAQVATLPVSGDVVTVSVDPARRAGIQRHHTVTHLLHWALHEVASKEASQKGSFVGPDKLTFDFNSAPLTPQQISDIEKLVNEKILENANVSWTEVAHADVKHRKDVMQFFGDKYSDTVRVVQIGGDAKKLNGYSMELCGGTHVRATGEIGLFRILGESAIAAGVRRIEAIAGLEAYKRANEELHLIKNLAGKINSPVHELEKKMESLLAHQKELEKQIKSANQKEAAVRAKEFLANAETINEIPVIIANLADADGETLQAVADSLKSQFK
ncbi:MAG TPA: alanine--tRNA ligase-related protein, partial [Verrucomicrobiae bacterium]|nr:alanine--tRNA ligase-related protein [Verrucomicrobiae bacterium]